MKIKQDFITNSSSSSFILCLPENPKIDDVLKLNPLNTGKVLYGHEDPHTPHQIAKTFLENFKHSSKHAKEELYNTIEGASVYQNVFQLPRYKEPRDMLDNLRNKMAKNHNSNFFHLDYPEEQELLKDLMPNHSKLIDECFNKWWERQLHKNIYSIELENHDYEGIAFGKDSDIIVISNH